MPIRMEEFFGLKLQKFGFENETVVSSRLSLCNPQATFDLEGAGSALCRPIRSVFHLIRKKPYENQDQNAYHKIDVHPFD